MTFPLSVPGLEICADYVTRDEEARLLAAIDRLPWSAALRRRVQHYGRAYEYRRRSVSNAPVEPLPPWAAELGERLLREGRFSRLPEQVIVNEYVPGQGIAAHVDRVDAFGPVVASLSLGSAVTMDFVERPAGRRLAVRVAERSLMVLSGSARSEWAHGIAARRSDEVDGAKMSRGRRVSITFRTLTG
jgi:alkylated DNA repair dioxygenase AlkB